jgi:hypothetical protein
MLRVHRCGGDAVAGPVPALWNEPYAGYRGQHSRVYGMAGPGIRCLTAIRMSCQSRLSQRQGAPPPPTLQQPPSCSGIGHEIVTTWSHPPPFGPGQPQRPTAGHYFQDNPRRFSSDYSAFPTTFPSGHAPTPRSSRHFAETYDRSDHHVQPSHGTTRDFRGDTRTFSRSRSRSTDRRHERSRSPISFSSRRRSTSRSPSEASFSSRPSTDEDSLSISQRASVAFTEVGKLLQFPPLLHLSPLGPPTVGNEVHPNPDLPPFL